MINDYEFFNSLQIFNQPYSYKQVNSYFKNQELDLT